jgi:HEPN domain-containing protein
MSDRSRDWFRQAERDLEVAEETSASGLHEFACFAAHQAAEKALKAVHFRSGQDVWGHSLRELVDALPEDLRPDAGLRNRAITLDAFYIPTRYPNGHASGAPFENDGLQSEEAVRHARSIVEHARTAKARRRFAMRVRSSSTRVLRWPGHAEVAAAVRAWAAAEAERRPELVRLGYFGSYARGDWGVGSDVNLVAIVTRAGRSPWERPVVWETAPLPVPADLLVYTTEEWRDRIAEGDRFARTLRDETVWVFDRL